MNPIRRAGIGFGRLVSRGLDAVSARGVIPGRVGADTTAKCRWGFYIMPTNGPMEAMSRDFRGLAGGLLALAVGRPGPLARGMRTYQLSAQYVYEKVRHGEVGRGTDIPIVFTLGRCAVKVVETYPEAFARALESGDRKAIARAVFSQPLALAKWFALYPVFTFLVLYSVASFMVKALRDGTDAQKYALCELAIMGAALDDAAKDAALDELRKTAPNTIIQFEYYVPLLVPFDGTVEDKVQRRNAAGGIIDNHSVVPSVFSRQAIRISQSICCEVIGLRSFLWLYGDERVARAQHDREAARKFGPEAARRMAEQPIYPLLAEQIAELTQPGPRTPEAVAATLDGLLRERKLDGVADRIAAASRQVV